MHSIVKQTPVSGFNLVVSITEFSLVSLSLCEDVDWWSGWPLALNK